MLRLNCSWLRRSSVAIIAVAVALLLTQLVLWQFEPSIYPFFFAAVTVSSWRSGLGSGLLATALSALACDYLFIPPLYSLAISSLDSIVGLVQFVLVAVFISFLNQVLRSTQQRAESNALKAQRNYERLRQTQESLHQSEERYRLLVNGVTDYAIFMLSPNGCIISWNAGAETILGYQEAEILGQPLSRLFTSEAIERGLPEQILRKALKKGFVKETRWHIRKDGTHLWTNCIVSPISDGTGNLRGFSKIMQDITQRKQAEEEREQLLLREQAARAEAEAANRSKDDFLAIVSHELRTPLTAVLGWAGILRAGKLDEDGAALAIETIERNADRQMQLVEDLLDISRIIRGELSLNCRLVDLVEAVEATIEVMQPAAEAKSIQLESVLDASIEPILCDPDRLQQVVLNLLSNAIKFTPEEGRVEVRLSMISSSEEETTGNYAQIQVSDTGKGISADFLPYVFDRFRQADSKSTRSHQGLGLGLAIARHLVELHGGTITAESSGIGQGAMFTVKLPFKAVPSLEATLTNPPDKVQSATVGEHAIRVDSPILKGLRVLVVDDEADVREWISIVLRETKAEVIAMGSVDEALKALANLKPDVLVSDIGMPGEDGYTLIRKVRELESEIGRNIPAVALTGYARVEDYSKALSAGFQLHVAKPIQAAELVAVVASLARMSPEFG